MKNSSLTLSNPRLLDALLSARLHDPYEYLGPHGVAGGWTVRIFNPHAQECWLRLPEGIARAKQVRPGGLFEWRGEQPPSHPYRIGFKEGAGTRETHDPYDLYRGKTALHDLDFEQSGFEWIDCHDADHSTLCFIRRARNGSVIVVVLNHTPVPRYDYRIGLPQSGSYREIFNSDSHYYCGANTGNAGVIHTQPLPWMGQSHSAAITLPPLAGIFLEPETS